MQLTLDISGPPGIGSSASIALSASLASKLAERLGKDGLTTYAQTWKERTTPLGRLYWEHTASAPRTNASAFGGWPTPDAQGHRDGTKMRKITVSSAEHGAYRGVSLHHAAQMTGWPTPTTADSTRSYSDESTSRFATDGKVSGHGVDLNAAAQMAGWATPRSPQTGHSTGNPNRGAKHKSRLEDQCYLAGWATPTGRDHKDGARTLENTPINGLLGRQVSLSTAPMVRRGQLDPTLVRWLQGYPSAWLISAPHNADWRRWQVLMAPLSAGPKRLALVLCARLATLSARR